jgi:hypothetical protein
MTRTPIVRRALLTLICLSSAQAEEPTVVTLSCDGTAKVYVKREEGKREPISQLGIVVNLTERTVLFDGNVVHIDQVDDAGVIYFGGDKTQGTTGYINRPTGATRAINMGSEVATYYELVCK